MGREAGLQLLSGRRGEATGLLDSQSGGGGGITCGVAAQLRYRGAAGEGKEEDLLFSCRAMGLTGGCR